MEKGEEKERSHTVDGKFPCIAVGGLHPLKEDLVKCISFSTAGRRDFFSQCFGLEFTDSFTELLYIVMWL